MTEPEDTPTPPHKSPTPKTTGLGAQMSRRMGAGPRRRAPGRPPPHPESHTRAQLLTAVLL